VYGFAGWLSGESDVEDDRRKEHWDRVYREKEPTQTSWYQSDPALSLALIERAALDLNARIIDVGGGASVLVDRLLQRGFQQPSVLDISAQGLEKARARLPVNAAVDWIVSSITEFRPTVRYALWHDRALFHFLTDPLDRTRYLAVLREGLAPQGQLIVAAFAPDGPSRCSGLEVVRYDAEKLGRELGAEFQLLEEITETHITPSGLEQRFGYFRYIYQPAKGLE
jgi:hypothetical protein